MKYKVGDKVRIVSKWPKGRAARQNNEGLMDKWLGKVMTIREVRPGYYMMEEDRADRPGFWTGWAWNEAAISGLANAQKILVTTDGKTTTAKLFNGKDLVKSAEAKCSPSDTFDFEKGAALAVDRLLGHEEKPTNPFKVGDFVQITSNFKDLHFLPIGSVGRVTDTLSADRCGLDAFDKYGHIIHQIVRISDLIKI